MNGNFPLLLFQASPEFKNRRTGLLVFGLLEILRGFLPALMVPLMVAGQLMAGRASHGTIPMLGFLLFVRRYFPPSPHNRG